MTDQLPKTSTITELVTALQHMLDIEIAAIVARIEIDLAPLAAQMDKTA